jgi:hypothetical protein
VGGCGRSGTTLLSVMLDSHSNLCCGPESRLFCSPSVNPHRLATLYHLSPPQVREWMRRSASKAQFIETFAGACCEASGKRRWAEKTPGNIHAMDYLFAHFPDARFIHVIRDGRDVVCSLRTHPKYKLVRGRRVETGVRRSIRSCAERWVGSVRAGLAWRGDSRYIEVQYRELVLQPESTLRRLLGFLGEPWDSAMLSYPERRYATNDPTRCVQNPGADQPPYTTAMGRWRQDLSPKELATFYQVAGPLMDDLGYRLE